MSIFEEGENGLITTPADKIGKKLIFLTNTSKDGIDWFIRDLNMGKTQVREIIEGNPQPSETVSVSEMKKFGIIGLYEYVPVEYIG